MRVAKPGEGRRLKPLWKPWLGIAYDEAMDSLDDGLLIDGYEVLELVLYAEDRATGQVAGMLFAGPGSKLLLAVPEELRPDLAQLVTKLVAVAVDPGARAAEGWAGCWSSGRSRSTGPATTSGCTGSSPPLSASTVSTAVWASPSIPEASRCRCRPSWAAPWRSTPNLTSTGSTNFYETPAQG